MKDETERDRSQAVIAKAYGAVIPRALKQARTMWMMRGVLLKEGKFDVFRLEFQYQHVVVPSQRPEANGEREEHQLLPEPDPVATEKCDDECQQEKPRQKLAAEEKQSAESAQKVNKDGLDRSHTDVELVDAGSGAHLHRLLASKSEPF